jgi:hypothetical protein
MMAVGNVEVRLERGNYYAILPVEEEDSMELEAADNVEHSATGVDTVGTKHIARGMVGQFAIALLPSFVTSNWETQNSSTSMNSQRAALEGEHDNTAYLDGMRGSAAVVVFIGHYALPYQPGMIYSRARRAQRVLATAHYSSALRWERYGCHLLPGLWLCSVSEAPEMHSPWTMGATCSGYDIVHLSARHTTLPPNTHCILCNDARRVFSLLRHSL